MIRKAVIPAAGLGTRFLPATKSIPKEMLPIVDKPILQYIIEEAVQSGIEQIVLVTGRQKQAMEDHFDISYELEDILAKKGKDEMLETCKKISSLAEIVSVRQHKPLGLGHAIGCAKQVVGNEPFLVLLPDDMIYNPEYPGSKQLMDVYEKYGGGVVGLIEVPPHQISWYGIVKFEWVDGNVCRVWDMIEKPKPEEAPSNLGIVSRYVFPPEIFKHIENTKPGHGGEIQITDAIRSLAAKGDVFGCKFEGQRFDAGDKLGFLEATIHYALEHPQIRESFRELLKNKAKDL